MQCTSKINKERHLPMWPQGIPRCLLLDKMIPGSQIKSFRHFGQSQIHVKLRVQSSFKGSIFVPLFSIPFAFNRCRLSLTLPCGFLNSNTPLGFVGFQLQRIPKPGHESSPSCCSCPQSPLQKKWKTF